MRHLRVPAALLIVGFAILGALLHPLVLILGLAPIQTGAVVRFLGEVRSAIADLLGWGVLGLLVVMAAYVVFGRSDRRRHQPVSAPSDDANTASVAGLPFHTRVVVAITAYNDALATANTVKDFLRQPSVDRVLVIDNNSTDETERLATEAGATVIRETQQGYGFACIRGLSEALKLPDANVIVLTEGDGTFVAEDTAKFLSYMKDGDFVVGNRVVRSLVDNDSQMDYFFTWGNMAVAMLLRLRFWDGRFLGPAGLTDVGCTFRAIKRPALERILPDLRVGGNYFSPHMMLVAVARGLTVIEIPIRFRRRIGVSKGASQSLWKGFEVGLAMIWHIMTFRLPRDSRGRAAREPEVASPASVGRIGHSETGVRSMVDANANSIGHERKVRDLAALVGESNGTIGGGLVVLTPEDV